MEFLHLAGDVGFSDTKIAWREGPLLKTIRIPSAVAMPMKMQASTLGNGQQILNYNGNDFVVGDDALHPGSRQIHDRNESWLLKYMATLMHGAAARAGIDLREVTHLTLGLPLNSCGPETRSALAQIFRGAKIDGVPIIHRDCQIRIHCQGVGALAAFRSENIPYEGSGLVLDLGGNTLISVYFSNLTASASGSYQYNHLGMMSAAEHLVPFLSKKTGSQISTIKATNAMRTGRFLDDDITAQRDLAIAKHLELLTTTLRNDYTDMVGELSKLVLAGGGAEALYAALPIEWQKKAVILYEPEFANVRGYHALSEEMNNFGS